MEFSRASSQLLSRALCPRTFTGSAGAGSTCWPSSGLLCNRSWYAPFRWLTSATLLLSLLQVLVGNRTPCVSSPMQCVPSCVSGQLPADGGWITFQHVGNLVLGMSGFLQIVNLVSFFSGEVCVVHLCNFDWQVKRLGCYRISPY